MDQHVIDGITVLPPLLAEYRLDPVFEIKHNLVAFEQGYSFEYHNMLKNTRDVSFNKSSNFYLTDSYNYNDIVDMKELPRTYPETISSYLVFNRIDNDPLSALSATSTCLTSNTATSAISADDTISTYLTILDTAGTTGDQSSTRQLSAELFVDVKTKQTLEQKYYFNIMFIDGYRCLIYHLVGDDRYYLSFDHDASDPILEFIKIKHDYGLENNVQQVLLDAPGTDGEDIIFMYNYFEDDSLIRLYKNHDGVTKVMSLLSDLDRETHPDSVPIVLQPTQDPDYDNDTSTSAPNVHELTNDTTLRLRPRTTKLVSADLESRIFNYTNTIDQNNVNVNDITSYKGLDHNIIAHSEYYFLTGTSIPINIIPLKNQLTDKGYTIPENQWNENVYTHRKYNKLFTGSNQLQGTDKIYMDYTSNSHDISFTPGMNYFNFPQQPDPVKKLNVNDTNLIKCGAISSNRPSGSDKIFKKLANYKEYTNWGNPTNLHTGTWLCSWLSGSNDPDVPPIWMDRYYNPSLIGGTEALSYDTSYKHNRIETDTDDVYKSTRTVYDKPSELTFEPGCSYAYYRLDSTDHMNNVSNLDPCKIQSGLDEYQSINGFVNTTVSEEYTFMRNNYAMINGISRLTETPRNFTISFDMDIADINSPIGHQLIGNYTNKGLGLFNVNDVSPFVFIPGPDGVRVNGVLQDSSIRIYDNNYNLYNYITNNSFIEDAATPALFKKIILRELPDNIFCLMTDGKIIEMTHDGTVIKMYNQWVEKYNTLSAAELLDVAYDNESIYLLSTTTSGASASTVDVFDMNDKTLSELDMGCVVEIPKPEPLQDNDGLNYGKEYSTSSVPNLIYVKDDHPPYQDSRTVYIGYGDNIKSTSDTLWIHVSGERDAISNSQTKHDMIYSFSTKTLQLNTGYITDNNLSSQENLLQVTDYLSDVNDNIWVAHNTSYISKFNNDRDILATKQLEGQEILSMVITRDLTSNGIETKLVALAKLVGDSELQLQIGPSLHPTDNPDDPAYRKASPFIEDGDYVERPTFINPNDFDDTIEIIYPFSLGRQRFGEHTRLITDVPSSETIGRVTPGDYTMMTEGLDIIVNEEQDIMYGHVFNIETVELVETKSLENFSIDDINIKPQMYNHYEYSKENFEKYHKNNLNFKIKLTSLFENISPDYVNLKFDLEEMAELTPYTGYHNISLVIDNDNGRVEFWVDGNLNEETRVYKFDPGKHTFHDALNTNLIVGATPYLKNTILEKKLSGESSYLCNNMTIKNINCFTKALNYHEQIDIIRSTELPETMNWLLPSGLRNYIEGVDRVFNHSLPPSKSGVYEVEILNSLIQVPRLQQYLENKLTLSLDKYAPGNTNIRNIKWLNELLLST